MWGSVSWGEIPGARPAWTTRKESGSVSSPSEMKSGNDWSHSSQKGIWSPISSFNFEKESEDWEPFFKYLRKLLSWLPRTQDAPRWWTSFNTSRGFGPRLIKSPTKKAFHCQVWSLPFLVDLLAPCSIHEHLQRKEFFWTSFFFPVFKTLEILGSGGVLQLWSASRIQVISPPADIGFSNETRAFSIYNQTGPSSW